MATTAMTAAGLVAFSFTAKADNWTDHQATGGGSITIDTATPNTTNITQFGDTVKVQGDGDINAGWTVNVAQPSSGSRYVLFDIENDPTYIMGSLNANGQIFIFDQNGTVFGQDSVVNVGSLITSTGSISDANLAAGRLQFDGVAGDGAIEIQSGASITVADAGLAAFVAPTVSNAGVINARMGTVVMAAGETVTLDMYGDGLVEVAVDGELADALLENKGTISAQGGTVQIAALAAKGVVDNIINMEGVIDVSSVSQQGGKIVLSGGNKGKVSVSGIANASGATGGGEIKVTGQDIEVSEDAIVLADANNEGNGGDVNFYADRNAIYRGDFYARGGATSGNGGFVELSAAGEVGYDGSVNTSATNGAAGSFLLDPLFAIIHSGSIHTPLGFEYILSAEALANDIHRNGSVTVQADNFIDVGTDIDLSIPILGSIGNGDIDMSAYDYDVLNTHGTWMWWLWTTDNFSGTTAGDLTLDTQTVNFNKNLTLGTGNLNILADTVNLDGTLSDINGLLDQGDITSTASVVNVLSAAALIQQGIYAADDGATVNVGDGTYNESLNIEKSLTLQGTGTTNTTIIDGVDHTGTGITVAADNVSLNGMIVENFYYGINVDSEINDLAMDDIVSRHNAYAGLHVTNAGGIDGFTVTNSHFDDNDFRTGASNDWGYGWYFAKGENDDLNTTTVTDVTVTDTTFSGNSGKGMYIEKLDNASFTNVDVIASGTWADSIFGNAGIDINLKNGTYENLSFDNLTVTGSGLNSTTRAGNSVTIKARNDGATYSATPATLTNLTIDNSEITAGGDVALAMGNGIDGAEVKSSDITGSEAVVIFGGATDILVRNNTISSDGQGYSARGNNVGVLIESSSGNKIRGNTILTDDDGIIVDNSSARIVGNTITGPGTNDTAKNGVFITDSDTGSDETVRVLQNTISGFGEGVDVRESSTRLFVENNFINGNAEGVNIGEDANGSKVKIFDNDLSGNTKGVENRSGETVDASGNYWGSDDESVVEAYMLTTNGGVDFSPFLMLSTDTSAATGFQGDFSKLFVTALGEQTQTGGRINEAVGLLENGSLTGGNREIHVGAGTFDESVIVDKAVTLLGNNAGIDGFFTVRNPESIVTGGSPAFDVFADNVTIDGFTMDGLTLDYGVKLNDVKGIEVVNNIINGSSVAAIGGVVDHDNAVQVDLFVEGNRIDDSNTGDGINISGDGAGTAAAPALVGSRIDITNNLIGYDGADAGGGNNGVGGSAIVFSTIGDPADLVDGFYGPGQTTASEINITSNGIFGATDGIRFDGGVDEADVNISSNGRITGLSGKGVRFNGDVTNSGVAINGNGTVSGTVGGIAFDGSVDASGVEIDGNTTIFSALADAIRFNGITGGSVVDVTENNAIIAGGNGINFSSPGSASINDGSVVTVAKNGINATFDGIFVGEDITGAGTRLNIGANTITADRDGIDIDHISGGANVDIGGPVAHNSASTSAHKGNIIDAGGNGIEVDAGADAIFLVRGNRIGAGTDGVNIRDNGDSSAIDGGIVTISDNDMATGGDTIGRHGINIEENVTGNSTVTISGNNIGNGANPVGGSGIVFGGAINGGSSVIISENNHGIHANDHGMYFGGSISGNALVDIDDNIITANEDRDGVGAGIYFNGSVTNATVNIGDGNGGNVDAGGSNVITVRTRNGGGNSNNLDGIRFAGTVGSGADINIDGNRIGYFASAFGGPVQESASGYNRRIADDGIEFSTINGDADIAITDNWIRSNDDGIVFNNSVSGTANILIGGDTDRNTILANNGGNGHGIIFDSIVSGQALVEISYNDIDADQDGVFFNGSTGNAALPAGSSEQEIFIDNNTITGGDNGIRFRQNISTDYHDIRITNNTVTGESVHGINFEGNVNDESQIWILNNDNITGYYDGIHFDGTISGDATIEIVDNTRIEGRHDDAIDFVSNISENAVVRINSNDNIRADNTSGSDADNGIEFSGVSDNAVVEIQGNNHGIHANGHGIYFGGTISGAADLDIHDNIITADDNNNGNGDGIRFNSGITGNSTVNIGDGDGADFDSNPSNIISGVNGIYFNGDVDGDARLVIDGNRLGFGASTLSGPYSNDRLSGNGIYFAESVDDDAVVEITDNWIRSNNDGIHFDDDIHDDASILIGGSGDKNTINANGDGIEFDEDILDNVMIEISHNEIEADLDGVRFEGDTSNADTSFPFSEDEILIANNSIEAGDNGINFLGRASGDRHDIMIRDNTQIHGHDGQGINHTGGIDGATLRIQNNDDVYGSSDGMHLEGFFFNDAQILVDGNTDVDSGNGDGIEITDTGLSGNSNVDVTNNHVHNTGDNAIEINNIDNVLVESNYIHNAGNDGVHVNGGSFAWIEGNTIQGEDGTGFLSVGNNGADRDGVHVEDNRGVTIVDNHILGGDGTGLFTAGGAGAARHGIFVDDSRYANINFNNIEAGVGNLVSVGGAGAGDDGIHVEDSRYTDIFGNLIDGVDGDGIDVDDSRNTDIGFNRVRVTGDNGIEVSDSRNTDIFGNLVSLTGGNGIDVHDSRGVDIMFNGVFLTSGDGIHVGNSRGADILWNLVALTGEDGIDVHDSNWVDVNNNGVFLTGGNGISVRNSDYADISDNMVQFIGENGIYVNPSNFVSITGNTIDNVADDGIDVNDGAFILIDNNKIGTIDGNIGDDGIDVDGSSLVLISRNEITGADEAGVELTDTDGVAILFNNIYENGDVGLWGRGAFNTYLYVAGNQFTDQDIHAQFESGVIDLTGSSNTFTDGRVGMRFAPAPFGKGGFAPMSLVDDDGPGGFGGTIGHQIFDGQSQYYVELDNGAFFDPGTPTILNALDSEYRSTPFGTFIPNVNYGSGFPVDVLAFMESKFFHYNDDTSLGLFFFPLLPSIAQEDILQYFGPYAAELAGLNVTLLGLPGIPGGPTNVALIAPFAGGDGEGGPAAFSPEALNEIETAAGGNESTSCWNDAVGAAGAGRPVNFSYGGSAQDLLNSEASCGS